MGRPAVRAIALSTVLAASSAWGQSYTPPPAPAQAAAAAEAAQMEAERAADAAEAAERSADEAAEAAIAAAKAAEAAGVTTLSFEANGSAGARPRTGSARTEASSSERLPTCPGDPRCTRRPDAPE